MQVQSESVAFDAPVELASPELVIVDDEQKSLDITTEKLFQPQRLQDETFEQYKERRLVANYKNHLMNKGRMIWDSSKQGTYKASK